MTTPRLEKGGGSCGAYRRRPASSAGAIGRGAQAHLPRLLVLARPPASKFRWPLYNILKEIGPPEALFALRQEGGPRWGAMQALPWIGTAARAALPELSRIAAGGGELAGAAQETIDTIRSLSDDGRGRPA